MRSNKNNNNGKQSDEQAAPIAEDTSTPAGDGAAEAAPRPQASRWLEQVDDEAERLRHRWNEAQAELERTEIKNRELDKANAQLRREITDLKAYIDGRKEHWSNLQQRIEQYEDTIAGMEQVVRDAEDKLSKKDGERELLSSRIIELERRCAELAGRLQERERSQRDEERRLKEADEELERLRAELARSELAVKEASDGAREQAELYASLERGVTRRDKTIEELERKLQEQREAAKGADADRDHRVAELEQDLASRVEALEQLRGELEESRAAGAELEATVELARAELDSVRAETTQLRERLDEKTQLLDETSQLLEEKSQLLERALAEREELEARANDADQRLAAIERRHGGAADEVRSLRQELVAQQNLIGKLEAELDAKQEMITALQTQASARDSNLAPADAPVRGGETNGAPARADGAENVDIIRIGELFRHDAPGDRKAIAALEAPDGTTYLVTKPSVTIGRASSNDICIRREFVSRTHARLTVRGIGAIIEDAGSKNGILVNSEPVGRRLLVDGDIVSLGGKLDLKFVELDASARPGAPTLPAEAESRDSGL